MAFFLNYHESNRNLSHTKRMFLILDGHKSHVSLENLLKAKIHGVDMVSLPSYTSHELHSLNISCFKPLKQSFRAYRDAWSKKNIRKKIGKKELAQWISLAFKKALTIQNIQSNFGTSGIQPLSREAMIRKVEASEIFQQAQQTRQPQEEDVPNYAYSSLHDIQVEKIMEEGLPTSLKQQRERKSLSKKEELGRKCL